MDTSKEYIKMCDCEEIQGHRPGHWDAIISFWASENVFMDGSGDYWVVKDGYNLNEKIWLPTQDKIQEMMDLVEMNCDDIHELFCNLASWHDENFVDIYYVQKLDSGEQLWLAFYMDEKYSKVWTGTEWGKKN